MKHIDVNYQSETSIRARVILWLLEKGAPLHAKLNTARVAWNLNSDELLAYKQGSLGHTLGAFYKKEKFEPIPKAERHDVFHVLLGYSTKVLDEAAMQFFLLGNGKPSFFTVGTCIITLLLYPLKSRFFLKAYQKGQQSTSIRYWNFKALLHADTRELQTIIFNLN